MSSPPPPLPGDATAGATVTPFDQVAVQVAQGPDLVVRLPGVLLVVAVPPQSTASAAPPPRPTLAGWGPAPVPAPPVAVPAGDAPLGELVTICRRVSAAGARAPGVRLHEELRTWLGTVAAPPSFAVVAATEDGLALVLVGGGTAEVPDLGLRLTAAQGEDLGNGTEVVDRFVAWPPAALHLSAGSPVTTAPHPLADLVAGVVPGAAAVLSPSPAPPPVPPPPSGTAATRLPAPHVGTPLVEVPPVGERVASASAAGPALPPEPAAPPPPAPELPAPKRSARLFDAPADAEPPREPLPIPGAEPTSTRAAEPEDDRARVKGIVCKNGHLNDPRVSFCALCGIRTTQQTAVLVEGVRPPLGLLVFDDGATVSLDADYLLGREPETDARVASGDLRPLLVVDPTGGVSRHHAEIRLEGWDVLLVDTGSANGTLVAPRGAPGWGSLVPHQPVRLTPGMAVRMGGRQFAFESPHGAY
ncbi:FHA domain-containing protein [Geodermatophilus sp. SYSU D00766]